MTYEVFHRTWWAVNANYPNGLEPCTGDPTTIKRNVQTEEEARKICHDWNSKHAPGRLSRKAEYMSEEK